jgi:hypothetical protein
LAAAANAKQTEKIAATLADVMLRPQHGLQLRGTGEPIWMIAQALPRHKHLRKLRTRGWGRIDLCGNEVRRSRYNCSRRRAFKAQLPASIGVVESARRLWPRAVVREMVGRRDLARFSGGVASARGFLGRNREFPPYFEQKMRSLRRELQSVQALTTQFPVFLGTGNFSKQNRE